MDIVTKNLLRKAARHYYKIPSGSYINVIDNGDHYHIWYLAKPKDRSSDREAIHLSMKIDMLPRTTEILE